MFVNVADSVRCENTAVQIIRFNQAELCRALWDVLCVVPIFLELLRVLQLGGGGGRWRMYLVLCV